MGFFTGFILVVTKIFRGNKVDYSFEDILILTTDALIERKKQLINALPDDDHARNFTGWEELDMIDDELLSRTKAM
jgi:hypothetical protein